MLDFAALSPAPASLQITLLLGLLIALVALGIDSTVPTLPALATAFATDPGAAQLTLTGLLAGVACGQLVWGPVSDRFGRRPALFASLALIALASAASAHAPDTVALAWLRFLQGIGLSCGPVVGHAIARDLYSHEAAAHLMSRMAIVFSLVPLCAPLVGSGLLQVGGWSAVYWLHGAIAVALALAVRRALPETLRPVQSPCASPSMAASFATLLSQRAFVAPLLVMLGIQLGVIAFVTTSSLALIRGFGMTPAEYSLAFAAVMLGQIGGALLGSRLVMRHGIRAMLRLGAALAALAGLALAGLAWFDVRHWGAVVAPMVVYLFASSFVLPNARAAALTPFPAQAGSAASLMGTLAFAVGSVLAAVLGWSFDGSARPMANAVAASALGAWLAVKLLPAPREARRG